MLSQISDIDSALGLKDSTSNLSVNENHRPPLQESRLVLYTETETDDAPNETEIRRLLALFFRSGMKDPRLPSPDVADPRPIHLHGYRRFEQIRTPYPVCIPTSDTPTDPIPLTAVFDELLEQCTDDSDEGRQRRLSLLRLEAEIRLLVSRGDTSSLSDLWDRAVTAHAARLGSKAGKETFIQDAATGKAALSIDGPLFPCASDTVGRLFAATGHQVSDTLETVMGEVEQLIRHLSDILAVDDAQSPDATDPDTLHDAVGDTYGEEIDFDAFSHLLEKAPHAPRLAQDRRTRIESVLSDLLAFSEYMHQITVPEPVSGCREAMQRMQEQSAQWTAWIRAYHIGMLEKSNAYKPDRHDAYFSEFSTYHLTDREQSLCPPVTVVLNSGDLDSSDPTLLWSLLSSDHPYRILLTLDDLWNDDPSDPEPSPLIQIASMAVQLQSAFVMQTTSVRVEDMIQGFAEGARFNGPALFCVYTGEQMQSEDLPAYLRSAAAREARAIPGFSFNPGRGSTWAARFRLQDNPGQDADWPVDSFSYETDSKETESVEAAFTFADLVALDERFRSQVCPLAASFLHPDLLQIDAYLDLAPADRASRLPFIWLVDQDGLMYRALVTRQLVKAVAGIRIRWRSIQELGGINNSHAAERLARETARLEEEKAAALSEQAAVHAAEMERAVDQLAREIVANIAAGLLQGSASGMTALPSQPVPVQKPVRPEKTVDPEPEAEAVQEAPVEEEEEEPLSLDEAYIETPRCTTCNECTTINNLLFAYNENQQAYIKDIHAGTYRDLVMAAEKCPVRIIHPGKPLNPNEPGLEELVRRAQPFV